MGLRFFFCRSELAREPAVARCLLVGADSVRDVSASRLGFLRRTGVRLDFLFRPLGRPPLANAPKEAKVLPRTSGFSLRRKIPSLNRSFRGPRRRAIPGPSPLSRHPCRSTPETPIQRGLLNGAFGVRGCFSGRLIKPKPKPKPKPKLCGYVLRRSGFPLSPEFPSTSKSRRNKNVGWRGAQRYPSMPTHGQHGHRNLAERRPPHPKTAIAGRRQSAVREQARFYKVAGSGSRFGLL